MTGNVDVVKKVFDACQKKDYEALRGLVHPDYTLKDPMMELHSADELIEMLKNCPGGGAENVTFVSEGDKVVSLFDGTMEGQPKMRMCSVVTIVDGKVKSEEMFYDTAKVPQEMKDMMQKGKSAEDAARAAH
jgi:ketosteroid isomerase-like protein